MIKNTIPNGIHYLIEFFGCSAEQIDAMDFWKKTLPASVDGTSMEVLHSYFHKFQPQGITGFLLLSSSHVSIHTWPDRGYVACDIFTCASKEETELVFKRLKKEISHKHISFEVVNRGYQFLNLPVFCNGEAMKVEINSILHDKQSDFQKIVIADTKDYGKCLIIDGVMQTAESDHEIYDNQLLTKLKKNDKNILILGGGDGYVAQMAIKDNPNLEIDIVDLDVEVINSAKKFLNQEVFDNKNIKLFIGDALHFLKTTDKSYDGIICDLTDTPIGTKQAAKEFNEFFNEIISLSKLKIEAGGWISVQSGASCTVEGFTDEASIIEKILKQENFSNIGRSDVFIPSYGESCAFLFAQKK
ncbi:MAG: adenosylmethionine decarboxylase [Candidatus Moraniibacteriota bacterium]